MMVNQMELLPGKMISFSGVKSLVPVVPTSLNF